MLKRYFVAGLLTLLPIWATWACLRFLMRITDNTVAMLPAAYRPEQWLGKPLPGLGLVVAIVFIFLTGLLVTNYLGGHVVRLSENVLKKIPIFRTIYTSVKQLASAMFSSKEEAFRKVVLIQYPHAECWTLAFQASLPEVFARAFPSPMMAVFVPTTPNPPSGFWLLVPTARVIPLDIPIESAFKTLVSLGVVT